MKKLLAILLAMAMLLCLAACGEEEAPASTGAEETQTEGTAQEYTISELCEDGQPHTFTEEVVANVSCEDEGAVLYICSKCDASYMEEVPAYGHDAYPATCEEPGICGTCGQEAEPALGHSFEGDVCKNCGMSEAEVQANTPPATTAPAEETESTETTETTETTEGTTAE